MNRIDRKWINIEYEKIEWVENEWILDMNE